MTLKNILVQQRFQKFLISSLKINISNKLMTLIELEKKYSKNFFNNYKQLIKLYDNIRLNTTISLVDKDITKAILLKMKAYYEMQYKIKNPEFEEKKKIVNILLDKVIVHPSEGNEDKRKVEIYYRFKENPSSTDISTWIRLNGANLLSIKMT